MRITINGVRINGKTFIDNNYFEMKERGLVGIKGKNGVGKTLLLKKLFFLLREQGVQAIFVEQRNNYVIDSYSIVENIVLSDDSVEIEKGKKFLKDSDMDSLINCNSKYLSGGEKRIVGLLRGLYHLENDNDVLIIDEPTNDLDHNNVKKVVALLKKTADNHLVILSSHDDRILAISKELFSIHNNHIERERDEAV